MSDQTAAAEKAKATPKPESGPFTTMAEVQAANSKHPKVKLFSVSWPGEAPSYCWTDGHWRAISRVCKAKGVTAVRADKVPTPEGVSALLAQLSPEQRAAIVAQYSSKKSGR